MDSALKKFNIYDYLGIYFGGVFIVTHLLISLPPEHLRSLNGVLKNIYRCIGLNKDDSTLKFILIFIILSYFVGIVFQEIGRIIFDLFGLNGDKTIRRIRQEFKDYSGKCRMSNKSKKSICPIKRDYQQAADALCPYIKKHKKCIPNFERVLSQLKYKDKRGTKRIDKYHAIYAFARNMFIYFSLSIIVCLAMLMLNKDITARLTTLLISDSIFIFLFFIRTKRYYISFVKNAYLQYFSLEHRRRK